MTLSGISANAETVTTDSQEKSRGMSRGARPQLGSSRKELRRHMRQRRGQLTLRERRNAAASLAQQLNRYLPFRRARHIGSYLAHGGELDTLPALRRHQCRGQILYLPSVSLSPAPKISMLRWIESKRMLTNVFGISEPARSKQRSRPLWALDVLLIPLVAFDQAGNRLGMGGGFYDRLLASLAHRPRKPLLIGIGYRFQQVSHIPTEPWDMPLDRVITD